MKKIATFLVGCLLAAVPVHSNATGLSLKELCAGEYAAKRIYGVNPLNDGESYSRLSDDHKQIITYSFKDGRQFLFVRQPGRRPDAHSHLQERQQGQNRKTFRRRRRQQRHIQQKHEVLHECLFQHPYSVRDHSL